MGVNVLTRYVETIGEEMIVACFEVGLLYDHSTGETEDNYEIP